MRTRGTIAASTTSIAADLSIDRHMPLSRQQCLLNGGVLALALDAGAALNAVASGYRRRLEYTRH
jgi:hypothetical protein